MTGQFFETEEMAVHTCDKPWLTFFLKDHQGWRCDECGCAWVLKSHPTGDGRFWERSPQHDTKPKHVKLDPATQRLMDEADGCPND